MTALPDGTGTRVAILEDHRLISESLRVVLEAEGYEVAVPALTRLDEVVSSLTARPPAVALLDLDLGDFGRGQDLLPRLIELGARVIVVSGSDEAVAGECLEAGAWGWVSKASPFDDLLGAIFKTAAGERCLDEREKQRLVDAWRKRMSSREQRLLPFGRLTRREAAVLAMLMEGSAVERIAKDSFVSVATVRTQVQAILMKLQVNSQLEAVAKANQSGWCFHDP